MIITRTPLRVSLLGGGTDYPSWFRQEGGMVLGGAINKYSFITVRYLPPFHDYRHRLVYREVETVQEAAQLRHPAVRAVLDYLGFSDEQGLEIAHLADLPARSGTGSSSTFVVGLLHALSALKGKLFLPVELAEAAIAIEQDRLGEVVGCQDQTLAAHGGLNLLRFDRDGSRTVSPLAISAAHETELENHLLLFFTRQVRTSSEVAATYVPGLAERGKEQFALLRLVEAGLEAVLHKDWPRLGQLVDQSWRIKAGLSAAVTNPLLNQLYARARLAGAWGGKLTGAGGGGCLLLVAPPEKHAAIRAALVECVHIPFRFSFDGSRILFAQKEFPHAA